MVAISFLSLLAVFGLLVAIAVSAVNTRGSDNRFLFTRSHICAYFVCLLLCWVLKGIGSVVNIQWLVDRMIVSGSLCTAQGVLKHVSDVGIAVWTTIMAVHTFCVLFLELKMCRYTLWLILTLGWVIIFFVCGSGPLFIAVKGKPPFYAISGHSCWISPVYRLESTLLAWVVMLIAAGSSTILYLLTFFKVRGNIVLNGWKPSFRFLGPEDTPYSNDDQPMVFAKQMMMYPLTYAIMLAPIGIIWLIDLSGKAIGFEWVIFGSSVYMLTGLLNVILFATTRRLLPYESLRFGDSYLVPSSRVGYGASYDKAEKGGSKTVKFASAPTILKTPPGRREFKRPPSLVLVSGPDRDSMASMYSVREGVHFAPMSSHWSPDTPPLPSRLSVVIDNVTSIAQRI